MKSDTGLVDTKGQPLWPADPKPFVEQVVEWWRRRRPEPARRSDIVHAPRGSAPRPWRRADSVMDRRRTDGKLTRKARKARARAQRVADRYGIKAGG